MRSTALRPMDGITSRVRVLAATQLSALDQASALAKARTVITGDDALKLQGHGLWGCQTLDQLGRVRVLRYKGAEVAIFFKRSITELEPFPGDPVPAGVITDPDDVWVRLELLGPSAKMVAALSTKQRVQLTSDVKLLQLQLEVAEESQGLAETKLLKTQQALDKAQEEITKLKAEKKKVTV